MNVSGDQLYIAICALSEHLQTAMYAYFFRIKICEFEYFTCNLVFNINHKS